MKQRHGRRDAMPLVEMEQLSKDYQLGEVTVNALKNLNLQIDHGEFIAVWGPSGSGKTTLLNIIGTIDAPSTGALRINGQPIAQLSDNQRTELRNRTIGFVFQHFNLVPVLSALENVMLPLQIGGKPNKIVQQQAAHRLEDVHLSEAMHRRPSGLSGGQQQRVAIARALVTNPDLVIADEPTANLDSDTARSIIQIMHDLNEQENTTFIFSTHDQRLLDEVKRKFHLKDGHIVNGKE